MSEQFLGSKKAFEILANLGLEPLTVGRMAIASAWVTPVPPAPAKQRAIGMKPPRPTPWVVVKRIKVGINRAPDGGGWQM